MLSRSRVLEGLFRGGRMVTRRLASAGEVELEAVGLDEPRADAPGTAVQIVVLPVSLFTAASATRM
jgi:hypothetical protein